MDQVTQTQPEPRGSSQPNGSHKIVHGVREVVGEFAHESKAAIGRLGDAASAPTTGAALAGAAVVGSAVLFGIAPTALAALAGFVTYRTMKKRRAER